MVYAMVTAVTAVKSGTQRVKFSDGSLGNTCGEGACFRWCGQLRPHHKGGGIPTLPNFGSYFLFMRTHFIAELPNMTR